VADDMDKYIEACNDSADKSRRPLALLVTAYVMVFCTIWNARDSSFQNSFVRAAGAAKRWLLATPAEKSAPDAAVRFREGSRFVETYGVDDPEVLSWAIEKVRANQVESALFFKVPFFSISVHINDLAIMTGLTFMMLLGWYRQCLMHHLLSIRVALSRASPGPDAVRVRELLTLHQFLTVPVPEVAGQRAARRLQFLLLVPCVVFQGYLALSNWQTRRLAFALGSDYAIPLLFLSAIFFIVDLTLVVSCQSWLKLIAKEWRGA
jgi:hypothetical protein